MNANLRLQRANRIHLMLIRELGEGIDVSHLLRRPLYARDMLLVCDALDGTPLPELARRFRGLTPQADAAAPAHPPSTLLPAHGTLGSLTRRSSSPPSAT